MKSLEKKNNSKTTKTISHSEEITENLELKEIEMPSGEKIVYVPLPEFSNKPEPSPVKLKPYEFDPVVINSLIMKAEAADAKADIKTAKKIRTEVKKQIADIKKVHTENKAIINDFKGELIEYDFSKFEDLTSDLSALYLQIDASIKSIENGVTQRQNDIMFEMSSFQANISSKILDAKNNNDIQDIQIQISSLIVDDSTFGDQVANMESIKTKLMIQAGSRGIEIANAGGSIEGQAVEPIKFEGGMSTEPNQKYSDSELINAMELMGIPGKGWAAMAGSNGFAVYQVDDAKAPKSVRMALQNALEIHKSNSI